MSVNLDWNNLGFQYRDTACHIEYVWKDGKWDAGTLVKEPYLKMHMAASCLHYGQECFEGLKVFRQKNGKIAAFRPQANAERMMRTALRTCMAPVPVEMFLEALDRVVAANVDYIPPYGTGGSLYVRPLLIGTAPQIGVSPSAGYTFVMMVVPAGAYYKGGLKPVKALILDEYDRAAPLGTGDIKVGGNYAASLFAHETAKKRGFPVELYLDAKTHTLVEEFATSNFLGILKDGTYVTTDSHSVLPSVTNLTLQQICRDEGRPVQVRPVPYTELKDFTEIAACGTAVVVTPVYEIVRNDDVIRISDPDAVGPVVTDLYEKVQGIQYGLLPDNHGWCHEIKA
ncbi:MAG: branched-chain amino acid aminotransferase [Kiritimatiellia bacterium]